MIGNIGTVRQIRIVLLRMEEGVIPSLEELVMEEFRALVDVAKRNSCEETLDRLIISIRHIRKTSRERKIKCMEYAQFCMLHDIDVITMWAQYYLLAEDSHCSRSQINCCVRRSVPSLVK